VSYEAESIARALKGRKSGNGWVAHCPCPNHAHGDKSQSLSIADGDNGKLLLKCFAGGTFDEVMAALRAKGLVDSTPRQPRRDPIAKVARPASCVSGKILDFNLARPQSAVLALAETFDAPKAETYAFPLRFFPDLWDRHHIYTDEAGNPVRLVAIKREPGASEKKTTQFGMMANGEWDGKPDTDKRPMVPYRLPELLAAPTAPVFICEGEKDADTLANLGHIATTNPNGAMNWNEDLNKYFAGRAVIIVPDADSTGMKRIPHLYGKLKDVVASFRVVSLGLEYKEKHGEDITDWIEKHGHTNEEFIELARKAPEYVPEEDDGPPLLVSSADFVAGFVPPDYAIDGLVQRRYLYSLTANTGHGKTAVALLLAALKALGRPLGDREVDKGHVLYFAGENPDDARARWIALCERLGVEPDAVNVHFLTGAGKLSDIAPRVTKEVEAIGCEVSLIIVDTSIAFFDGDDENNNVQAVLHARRMRTLIDLPGGPCVIALCHPIKKASRDDLLPRGGGAFLNEVDGNLTFWNDDGVVTMHWLGKFRGPDFAPITFKLETATSEKIKDSKGRKMPTVLATALSKEDERKAEARTCEDEDALLTAIADNPRASFAGLAVALRWVSEKGENKAKVRRCADRLKKDKLVNPDRRGTLCLTAKPVFYSSRGSMLRKPLILLVVG
jgi:hypothetical protein